jgi:hypothetical protein
LRDGIYFFIEAGKIGIENARSDSDFLDHIRTLLADLFEEC